MSDDYERLKAQHKVLYKELEMASDLLADVYAQVGNHRPPTIRHALTPGLRDGIRDFLHARKTIAVKPTYDDYEYDGQPDQCHECDQPAVGWDGSSGAMLCAAHYKRPSTPKPVEYAGPSTVDEAKSFHEGFKAGAAAYAKQVKHDADPKINCILADLITESGWRCIEQFEKLTGRTV